jgi:hypothetical protein
VKRALAVLLLLVCASCGGSSKASKKTAAKKAPPGKIGAACTPTQDLGQGTCGKGLLCAPFMKGGYCASFCPCADGGSCVETAKMGEFCAKACVKDSDCRGKEGYVCDQQWSTCVAPGFLAPRAPTCEKPAAEPPRKTFGKVEQLSSSSSPGKLQTEPSAALTKNGDLVAVYIGAIPFSPSNSLGASTVSAKGAIVGGTEIKFDKTSYYDPTMASDRAGKVYLAYLGFDGGRAPEKNMVVGIVSSEDGQSWSAPVNAVDVPVDCPGAAPGCVDKPWIVIGPDRADNKKDAIYVFYFAAGAEALKVVKSTDGGATWSKSVTVGTGAVADAEVTASGKIHVVYATGGGNMFGGAENHVEYTKSEDGGQTWAPPARVSGEGDLVPIHFSSPQVIADANPDRAILYAVYPSGTPDGRWNVVIAWSRDGGTTWERDKANDDEPCAGHMLPSAALDPATGKVHITWVDNRTGAGNVVYTSCTAATKKKKLECAANELVSDKPFASYGFVRHSLRWLGDYNALLLDAKGKRLHAVWTQTVDEGGTPTARIFWASGKVK